LSRSQLVIILKEGTTRSRERDAQHSDIIRGGTERIVDEAERAVHDALCVVMDVIHDSRVVAGGGVPESEVARRLRQYAEKLAGKEQLAVHRFAEALEVVSLALAENAGLDPVDVLVNLRSRHDNGELWAGVDSVSGVVGDMLKGDVYEPLAVKIQVIKSASEAASMIIKIDDVIAASRMKETMPKGPEEGADEGTSEI